MSADRLLTLAEVADALRLSTHTIRSFARKGRLVPVRICRRLLFRAVDVEKLIAASCGTEERQVMPPPLTWDQIGSVPAKPKPAAR